MIRNISHINVIEDKSVKIYNMNRYLTFMYYKTLNTIVQTF